MAVLFALAGPRLVGPQNRAANGTFAYEPPDGFSAVKDRSDLDGSRAWVFDADIRESSLNEPPNMLSPGLGGAGKKVATVRVVATHSTKEMSVEEVDLAKLAEEMPKIFEDCTWVHRRHELRTRSDGGRVGLIEGDCNKDVELGHLGLPSQKLRSRKLQLMFPDDGGTSIVTASYPSDQAAKWEPLFEATINKAKGVAIRVPAPPPWTFAAWAAAGAILGFLATALFRTRGSAVPAPPPAEK